jgi:hypothetical protein
MAAVRAPKQWSLTTTETITSIEAWENNLKYILSLDHNFASFLTAGATWLKKTNASPLRGFTDDGEAINSPDSTPHRCAKGNSSRNDAWPNS